MKQAARGAKAAGGGANLAGPAPASIDGATVAVKQYGKLRLAEFVQQSISGHIAASAGHGPCIPGQGQISAPFGPRLRIEFLYDHW